MCVSLRVSFQQQPSSADGVVPANEVSGCGGGGGGGGGERPRRYVTRARRHTGPPLLPSSPPPLTPAGITFALHPARIVAQLVKNLLLTRVDEVLVSILPTQPFAPKAGKEGKTRPTDTLVVY